MEGNIIQIYLLCGKLVVFQNYYYYKNVHNFYPRIIIAIKFFITFILYLNILRVMELLVVRRKVYAGRYTQGAK